MARNSLLTIFVVILIHGSGGQKCRNRGNGTHIQIAGCDGVSFKELSRKFQITKIVNFNAWYQNNTFPKIDHQTFRNMSNLDTIWMSGCRIQSLAEMTFQNLIVLTKLGLRNNEIKVLHANLLVGLENLRVFDLTENLVEHIPATLFKGNVELKELWLSRNAIKRIPAGLFDELANLELLLIDHNQLEVIHPDTFQQTKKLKELYLQANKLQVIDKGTFNGLRELKYLNLKNNSYIDKEYGDYRNPTAPIDFNEIAIDLAAMASLRATEFLDIPFIIAVISTVFLTAGIIHYLNIEEGSFF
jgi:Leucine-rich repeat (LRR) protein